MYAGGQHDISSWARAARNARISLLALFGCMLLSGRAFSLIHPPSLAIIIVLACVALKLPRYRQMIETSYLIGLPLVCAVGALTSSSTDDVAKFLAVGLCGSIYGLTWFGFQTESPSPNWRRWTTAVPVLALAGSYVLLRMRFSVPLFTGVGLGTVWTARCVVAVAAVLVMRAWQIFLGREGESRANAFAICSFGAALTLCIAVQILLHLDRTNARAVFMAFLPYALAVLATLEGASNSSLQGYIRKCCKVASVRCCAFTRWIANPFSAGRRTAWKMSVVRGMGHRHPQ